jgi:hypothetical protein
MLAALAAIAVVPAAAWAQGGDLGRKTAGPGDTVTFQVDGTDRGATWTARLADGAELGSGEDTTDEPGTVGSFVVPDLGDEPRDFPVTISVSQGWELSLTLDYRPPAPAGGSPPPPPTAPGAPGQQRSTPPPIKTVAPPAPPYSREGRPQPAPATPQSRPVGTGRLSAGGGVARRIRNIVRHVLKPRHPASRKARKKAARKAKRAKRKAHRTHQRLGVLSRGAEAREVKPPRDTRVDLSDDSFPGVGYSIAWQLLLGVAVVGLLFAAAIAGIAHRRRREAELEDELDGLFAEDRARVLVEERAGMLTER